MASTSIPLRMKAQLLERYNDGYVFRDNVSVPQIQDTRDILVKVQAASFCHTDELLRTGSRGNLPELPFIGCHEFAGVVVAVGSAVKNVKPGDAVGVPTKGYHSCGSCTECMYCAGPLDDDPGYSVYCPDSKELGLTVPGGFAEYAVVDSRSVAPIPASMTALETAPMMCAGVTMFTALQKLQLKPEQSIGILGAGGGLGHLGLQFAEQLGLDVVAIEAADGPLQLARELAKNAMVVDARTTTVAEVKSQYAAQQRGGDDRDQDGGLDAVIILPETQKSFEYAMDLLKRHGTCMLVSVPREGFHVAPADVIRRDIRILGAQVGSVKTLREMMVFADQHHVRSRSHVYPFAELNRLLEDSHHPTGGKYVLNVDGVQG